MSSRIGDRFEIIDEIHHGQMANSYRAKDLESGSTIFLKILHPALKSDEDILMRFQREVKLAGAIDHPNVVKLVESGEIEGSLYISFAWQDGKLLSDFFILDKDVSGVTVNEAACCIAQILAGLQAIHDSGIVHRDLKPGNILLDNEGKIHILDFSLALSSKDSRITAHGNVVGTPGYLAPEVIAGANASPQSDLFAAGIIFYEMLSGEPLFSSEDIYSTLQKVHEAEIVSLTEIRDDVPPEVDDFIIKLLAKHPGDRFPDAKTALEQLLSIESLNIKDDSLVLKKVPAKKKILRYIYSGVFVIVLILAGVISLNIDTNHMSVTGVEDITSADSVNLADSFSEKKEMVASGAVLQQEKTHIQPEDKNSDNNRMTRRSNSSEPGKKEISERSENDNEKKPAEEKLKSASEISSQKSVSSVIPESQNGQTEGLPTDSVFIDINVLPWARVYIDGRFMGTTPLMTGTKCLPGEHIIRFEHPGFPVLSKTIGIGSGREFSLDINLENEFGRLDFEIIPWGYVFIDDMNEGTAPLPKPLYVAPGEHVIKIQHPNFVEFVRHIDIKAGEMITVVVNFTDEENK